MVLFLIAAAFANPNAYAEEAKARMKLSFDLDEVQGELAMPAPAAAAPRAGGAASGRQAAVYVPPLPLEPNSILDRVMVLRDRAIVTRTRAVKLSSGAQRVRFEGLPLSIDTTTLAAELRGGRAKVVGVELVSGSGDVEETERILETRKNAVELGAKLGVVRDQIEALLMQRAYLDGALLTPNGEARPAPSLDVVKGTLGWLGEAERDLAAKLRENEDKAQKLGEELEPLLTKLRDPVATGMTVRVDLDVAAEGSVDVALRYCVYGASWQPAYSARLDPDSNMVTLETNAVVAQSTGETWTNATLQLSTASPVVGGAAPQLNAWILDESGVDAGSLAVSGAAASGAGARVFDVEGRRTIAGDGSQASIPLTSQKAPTVLSLATVPRVTPEVFRTAAVTWTGESPLLPGAVASFVGGDYVGSANIVAVAPGEALNLGFGVDDRIRVDRRLVSRKVEHLMGGRTRTTVRYKTTVHNYAKVAQVVRLTDQVPVSQIDRITVSLAEPSLAPVVDPEAPAGVSSWQLALPAGGEMVVETGFTVTAPRELQSRMDQMLF